MISKNNSWEILQARVHFHEILKKAVKEGDQFINNHGEEVAVLISKAHYDALTIPPQSLLDFFYASPCQEVDLSITRSHEFFKED